MTKIPIYNYAKSSHRSDIIRKFYNSKIANLDPANVREQFIKVFSVLYEIKSRIDSKAIFNNYLLYEALGWGILVALERGINISVNEASKIATDISNSNQILDLWTEIINSVKTPEAIFEQTGSHYRNSTLDRYQFISNYFKLNYNISFVQNIKNTDLFAHVMSNVTPKEQLHEMKLNKPDPVSVTIDDVLTEMQNSKFLVRPQYQRSEVKNIQKSSYLIESIMLGITIPPIYIYRRKDLVVSEYRERKILKRFKVTPISPIMLLMVEFLIYVIYSAVSLATVIPVAMLFWKVEIHGSWIAFVGSWLLTMVSTLSIGMMVGGVAKNAKTASVIACILYFPMLIFSGATLPFEVMPETMQKIVQFFPMTQGIQLMKATFLGTPFHNIWLPVLVMLGVTILCFGVAVKCFKWE